MWREHDVVREDLERICATSSVPWEELDRSTVLVTGATGLIGGTLVRALLWHAAQHGTGTRVLALVRDRAKAERVFAAPLQAGAPLSLVVGDVETVTAVSEPVHLVVHGAGVTASRDFVERPLRTIRTAVHGTERVLELARRARVRSVAHLSSMEVYGAPDGTRRTTEADTSSSVDPMLVRSSYPESKRMAEALCAAHTAEHGVPAKVVRLTQTFGPGVARDDGRVFAELLRCAARGEDIVLRTTGETERSYLYTADAVTAVLTVLLRGADGEAYNAANEATYCSVRAMAELVARTCAGGRVRVRVEPQDVGGLGYAPTLRMDLDTAKLQALGWRPTTSLAEMYRRTAAASGLLADHRPQVS